MENAPIITSEVIICYEKLVVAVYERYYYNYSYLKDDLLQCGRWGLWLGLTTYTEEIAEKSKFIRYLWLRIRNKMWQYIDHEKHHITKECYSSEEYPQQQTLSLTTKLDINRALSTLTKEEYSQIVQWANYVEFKDMNFNNRQNAHYHFKRTLNKLKEKLKNEP